VLGVDHTTDAVPKVGSVMDVREKRVGSRDETSEGLSLGLI
jgi:hypothetical protein